MMTIMMKNENHDSKNAGMKVMNHIDVERGWSFMVDDQRNRQNM